MLGLSLLTPYLLYNLYGRLSSYIYFNPIIIAQKQITNEKEIEKGKCNNVFIIILFYFQLICPNIFGISIF